MHEMYVPVAKKVRTLRAAYRAGLISEYKVWLWACRIANAMPEGGVMSNDERAGRIAAFAFGDKYDR